MGMEIEGFDDVVSSGGTVITPVNMNNGEGSGLWRV